jgi:hypothetical protein
MPEKEPTQKMPKGLEIPIPTRETVDDYLAKSAEPAKPSRRRKRGARKE